MSTRANIRFSDRYDTFYVYRHSDGYPSGDILPDLRKAVERVEGMSPAVSDGLAQIVSVFLGQTYKPNQRLQDYEITTAIHGDEDFHYFVKRNEETKVYDVGYDEEGDDE